ncbi:MAG: T9SS type A sorting domain-containing protein [Bacteroidales bacterium]
MKAKNLLYLILFININSIGFAQNVVLDSSFGNTGIVEIPNFSEIDKMTVCDDGKIICLGYHIENSISGIYHLVLAKYNTDGTLDSGFGSNGFINTSIDYSEIPYALLVQSDEKILIAGSIYGSGEISFIVRYHSDGSLDNTFGINGVRKINYLRSISSLALLPNNQIIAGGSFNSDYSIVAKFNSDGTSDTTFGTSGFISYSSQGFDYNSTYLNVLNDGKILTCGSDYTDSNNPKIAIIKIKSDGAYDTLFGSNGKVIIDIFNLYPVIYDEYCDKFQELSNGKILLGGHSHSSLLIKLLPNGNLDSSFVNNGILTHTYSYGGFMVQNNGKILVCGVKLISNDNNGYTLTRFNSNGILDTSFNTTGFFDIDVSTGNDYPKAMSIQNDDKILITGYSCINNTYFTPLVRLKVNEIVSISENTNNGNIIEFSPNPFNDDIQITSKDEVIKEISIYDTKGILIFNDRINNFQKIISLDITKGIYICKVTTNKGNISIKKIIKN